MSVLTKKLTDKKKRLSPKTRKDGIMDELNIRLSKANCLEIRDPEKGLRLRPKKKIIEVLVDTEFIDGR